MPTANPAARRRGHLAGATTRRLAVRKATPRPPPGFKVPRTEAAPSTLSTGQQTVLDLAVDGKNVFFTGCAGTGKSYLLQQIIRKLPRVGLFVTASTGIAAVPLSGTTLHAFVGCGLAQEPAQKLVSNMKPVARQQWKTAKVLVIDEISMVSAEQWDKFETVARLVRHSTQPFGGIQLVVSGDFLQLPPVARRGGPKASFAFQATSWPLCFPAGHMVELRDVFRQSDSEFVRALHAVRRGLSSDGTLAVLNRRAHAQLHANDGIVPTQLFAKRREVHELNMRELEKLTTVSCTYRAHDTGKQPYIGQLSRNCLAPDNLAVKRDAQVMLLQNLSPEMGLVNGSRGVVVGFRMDTEDNPVSYNRVHVAQKWPLVKFTNGRTVLVRPNRWTTNVHGKEVAARLQVPLCLAWAVTVHKSQGMTLDRAVIDLTGVFEFGQTYVAISRMRNLEGMSLSCAVTKSMVQAAPGALEFYAALKPTQEAAEQAPPVHLGDVTCMQHKKPCTVAAVPRVPDQPPQWEMTCSSGCRIRTRFQFMPPVRPGHRA